MIRVRFRKKLSEILSAMSEFYELSGEKSECSTGIYKLKVRETGEVLKQWNGQTETCNDLYSDMVRFPGLPELINFDLLLEVKLALSPWSDDTEKELLCGLSREDKIRVIRILDSCGKNHDRFRSGVLEENGMRGTAAYDYLSSQTPDRKPLRFSHTHVTSKG